MQEVDKAIAQLTERLGDPTTSQEEFEEIRYRIEQLKLMAE